MPWQFALGVAAQVDGHRLTVVIADDHPVVLKGLSELLAGLAGCEVLASCPNGAEALESIRAHRPVVAVLDVRMPLMDGLDVLRAVKSELPETKVVLLSALMNDAQLVAAVDAGVDGIVPKDSATDELARCVEAVAAGRRCIPADLLGDAVARERARGRRRELLDALTDREREIVGFVREGLSNKEIARQLDITDGTIKTHLHNIYVKLGVSSRTRLAMFASETRAAAGDPDG